MAEMMDDDEGQLALSVEGPRTISGLVLPWEHLNSNLSALALDPTDKWLRDDPVSLSILGKCRKHPWCNVDNLKVRADDMMQEVVQLVHGAKPANVTVVDITPICCQRDPGALRHIAQKAGLQVIMGTGWGSEKLNHPPHLVAATAEEIADAMVEDLTAGSQVEGQEEGVCAGVIGEVGVSSFSEYEQKHIKAAALAHRRTRAPVFVNLGVSSAPPEVSPQLAEKVLDLLELNGATVAKTVMLTTWDNCCSAAFHEAVLQRGALLCLHGIGTDVYLPTTDPCPLRQSPSDTQIAELVTTLVQQGWGPQLLLSHNLCMKLQCRSYGGYGLDHLSLSFLPRLRAAGVSEDLLEHMTVRTPSRLLSWWRPPPEAARAVKHWQCAWCGNRHEEAVDPKRALPTDQAYYEKFEWRYCSMPCLQNHRKAGFKKLS